jgi:hypothetical protein
MDEKLFMSLLQFRKDYPTSPVNLDDLVMILNASRAVLLSQSGTPPTLMEIIEFSKTIVWTFERPVCPLKG